MLGRMKALAQLPLTKRRKLTLSCKSSRTSSGDVHTGHPSLFPQDKMMPHAGPTLCRRVEAPQWHTRRRKDRDGVDPSLLAGW